MRSVVKKQENSASARIPAAVMETGHFASDALVDLREEGGRNVVEPVGIVSYDLDQLLSRITAENIHPEMASGEPIGEERL